MVKRINVILPEHTVRTIDRMTKPGERSQFIDQAVQHYVATASPQAVQEQLQAAAIRDRDLDLEISEEWFAVDKEQWQRLSAQERRQAAASRKGAKSTSRRSTRQ